MFQPLGESLHIHVYLFLPFLFFFHRGKSSFAIPFFLCYEIGECRTRTRVCVCVWALRRFIDCAAFTLTAPAINHQEGGDLWIADYPEVSFLSVRRFIYFLLAKNVWLMKEEFFLSLKIRKKYFVRIICPMCTLYFLYLSFFIVQMIEEWINV